MTIAVFDFDGTLTTRDSFLEFVRFSCGTWKLCKGIFRHGLSLILMKLGMADNGKTKERLFSYYFKGLDYSRFCELGHRFAFHFESSANQEMLSKLIRHQQEGDKVYVVSASIEEWVTPWCRRHGVDHVIGTQVETDGDGLLTGCFKTVNCYGKEKVCRFKAMEPHRSTYHLVVYGDSRGDREMLQYADEAHLSGRS